MSALSQLVRPYPADVVTTWLCSWLLSQGYNLVTVPGPLQLGEGAFGDCAVSLGTLRGLPVVQVPPASSSAIANHRGFPLYTVSLPTRGPSPFFPAA